MRKYLENIWLIKLKKIEMNIMRSLKQLTTITIFSAALFFASCKKDTPQPAIIEKNGQLADGTCANAETIALMASGKPY